MHKKLLLSLCFIATFLLGFGFKSYTEFLNKNQADKKATGIGGIFFKCKNPQKMRDWYQQHLGLQTNPYGAVFEWHQGADSTKKGFTQWSPFKETTKYFDKDWMINYRVENLTALVEQLQKDSVTIVDKIESVEYGKFVHILDAEGNKVELWEPNDVVYEQLGKKMGSKTTK